LSRIKSGGGKELGGTSAFLSFVEINLASLENEKGLSRFGGKPLAKS
jgi:hypothetical protein